MAVAKRQLKASEIVMLSPIDCGSTISYTIVKDGKFLSADMDLSDCTRKISWSFTNNDLAKINKVIKILTNFKKAFIKAKKEK